MKIGDQRGRRPFLAPNNQGMSGRANARLEHTVAAANLQHEAALRIDGVRILVWRAVSPARFPCTCSKSTQPKPLIATSGNLVTSPPDNLASGLGDFSILPGQSRANYSNAGSIRLQSSGVQNEDWLPLAGGVGEEKTSNIGQDGWPDPFEDIEVAEEDGLFPSDKSDSLDSFIRGDMVKCGVCAGSGYTDGWKALGGQRSVMAFLPEEAFESDGEIDTRSKPNVLKLEPGEKVQFTLSIPLWHDGLLYSGFSNNDNRVALEAEMLLDNVWVPLNLLQLRGVSDVATIRLVSENLTKITHFEAIFALGNPTMSQFPTVSIPFEREYLDFNTNVSIELSAQADANPGDVIIDWKHRRAWRIMNITRKSTAEGRSLPPVIDLRMLHRNEVQSVLNFFTGPTDSAEKRFAGRNDKWQGGNR